eukprot:7765026-Pyramimonas_sp.AAC.1
MPHPPLPNASIVPAVHLPSLPNASTVPAMPPTSLRCLYRPCNASTIPLAGRMRDTSEKVVRRWPTR